MTIRVLVAGTNHLKVYRWTHEYCGSVLEFGDDDVRWQEAGSKTLANFKCPVCGDEVAPDIGDLLEVSPAPTRKHAKQD